MKGIKSFKTHPLYRLFSILSERRKKQFYILICLLIINGLFESFSLVSIIPFITLFLSKDPINNISLIRKISELTSINNENELFLLITTLFCIFLFFATFFRVFNIWYISKLTAKVNLDFGDLLFRSNIYQSYESYTKKNSSSIISLIVEKISGATSALSSILSTISSLILVSAIVFSLLIYKWQILLFTFLFLYIYYLIIYKKIKEVLYKSGEVIASNNTKRIRVIQESFSGFRDLVINGTQEIYLNLFNKYESISKLSNVKSDFFITFPKYLIEGFCLIIIAILCFIFYEETASNSFIIPILASYIYAFQRLLPLTQQIYSGFAGIKYKYAYINALVIELENIRIQDLKLYSKKNVIFKNNIEFKNISFSYHSKDETKIILSGVNLKIYKGEYIGICGKTGSGKSTFLDIFMGLHSPNKGKIFIDNKEVTSAKYNWTSKISHVSQNIFLKEGSIAENIAFGKSFLDIDFQLLEKAAKIAHIYDFIKNTKKGFKTYVGERGITLSGGQKQRIAIARAIYQKRDILVLDEATSALDEKTAENIMNSILEMRNDLTILMVTHRLNSLKNCDRIFYVKDKDVFEKERN